MKHLIVLISVMALLMSACTTSIYEPSTTLPERTVFSPPIHNQDSAAVSGADNTISIPLRNGAGDSIVILEEAQATGDCEEPVSVKATNAEGVQLQLGAQGTEIGNGDEFILTFTCNGFNGQEAGDKIRTDLTFNYQKVSTGLARPHSGSVDAQVR